MRSNALKKQDLSQAYLQDNAPAAGRHARIAQQCEEAAGLKGNRNDPDYEEFTGKYGLNRTFA